ncbi:MAG: simple sugar transport system ATP-binding protein, partial [Actinomycetota bacterium]|nr:simple sugar transport system ATP-binding protein [Actinomycetota bacterium]
MTAQREEVPTRPSPDDVPLLSLRGVNKSFGAVHVLQDVDFDAYAGQVTALVGDNGAGKSTLIKGIAGIYGFDSGEYLFEGRPVTVHSPKQANALGIEVVYQDLALCNNLSASANVFLGREIKKRLGPIAWLDHRAMAKRAGELFGELKSETRPRDLVKQMSGGQRQAVA